MVIVNRSLLNFNKVVMLVTAGYGVCEAREVGGELGGNTYLDNISACII